MFQMMKVEKKRYDDKKSRKNYCVKKGIPYIYGCRV